MALTLYIHPLASFCHKVLIALYENGTPFDSRIVDFALADCAALPALFFASIVHPFAPGQRRLAAYLERLLQRPSIGRVIAEAQPYFPMFPYRDAMPPRYLAALP